MSSSSVRPTDCPTTALAGCGAFQASIEATRALALTRREQQRVADVQAAALDPSRNNSARVELVDVLHREPERQVGDRRRLRLRIERLEQRRSLVPGHGRAARAQVFAVARGERQEGDVGVVHADRAQVRSDFAPHLLVARLAPLGEVHLVDRDDDAPDAEQAQQVGMAPRLVLDAFVRVHHQDHGVGASRAAHHVLQELLVPRRVDQQVFARRAAEADLRGVDGDALVALGLHRVDHERPLEGHAALLGHRLHRLDLALGQRAGLVQQAAHQGRLAVVHVPDDHQLELVHHMYPSARRRSNASSDSWSIARPARSGTRVVSSSPMISSMLEALLAMGKVMSRSPSERYLFPSLEK